MILNFLYFSTFIGYSCSNRIVMHSAVRDVEPR